MRVCGFDRKVLALFFRRRLVESLGHSGVVPCVCFSSLKHVLFVKHKLT